MRKRHEEPRKPITVLGDEWHGFELRDWRQAIMCFLGLVWSGRYNFGVYGGKGVQENRRRGRGNVVLRIHTTQPHPRLAGETSRVSLVFNSDVPGYYHATGIADAINFGDVHGDTINRSCEDGPLTREEFESFLARFARNRKLKAVALPLPNPMHVRRIELVNARGRLLVGIR